MHPVAQLQQPVLLIHFIVHNILNHGKSCFPIRCFLTRAPTLVGQQQRIGNIQITICCRVCISALHCSVSCPVNQRRTIVALLPGHQIFTNIAEMCPIIAVHSIECIFCLCIIVRHANRNQHTVAVCFRNSDWNRNTISSIAIFFIGNIILWFARGNISVLGHISFLPLLIGIL